MLSSGHAELNNSENKIKSPSSSSTRHIRTALQQCSSIFYNDEGNEEYMIIRENTLSPSRIDEVPKHFSEKAKELIGKLIESNVYSLTDVSADNKTDADKETFFSLRFYTPHPSLHSIE